MNMKPFCLLFDCSLAVQQINTYNGNSALLKFQCLLLFSQSSIRYCWIGMVFTIEMSGKKGQYNRNRKLAAIMCSWNMRRLWTTISTIEREQGLSSLIDDWRHCCHCSWWKRRGATSMERGQVVFHARDCADVPFPFLKLNTYSNKFMSWATSPLLLSTSFW